MAHRECPVSKREDISHDTDEKALYRFDGWMFLEYLFSLTLAATAVAQFKTQYALF